MFIFKFSMESQAYSRHTGRGCRPYPQQRPRAPQRESPKRLSFYKKDKKTRKGSHHVKRGVRKTPRFPVPAMKIHVHSNFEGIFLHRWRSGSGKQRSKEPYVAASNGSRYSSGMLLPVYRPGCLSEELVARGPII